MKKFKLLTTIIALLFLTACSDDDNDKKSVTGDYYPSTENNYWNYDVKTKDNNADDTQSQDFIAVKSSSSTSFVLEANSGNIANGTMNILLTNGTLYKTESTLTEKGKLQLPIEGFDDFSIDFNSAVLYDLNADRNETLSLYDGEFTKELQGFPITIEYKLVFTKIDNQNSLKVNNNTYTNVTGTNIALNVSMHTTIEVQGNETEFSLIDSQDILSIDSYYAENIGLIKANAIIEFELDSTTILLLETLGVEFDIPTSQSITNTQELSSYFIGD